VEGLLLVTRFWKKLVFRKRNFSEILMKNFLRKPIELPQKTKEEIPRKQLILRQKSKENFVKSQSNLHMKIGKHFIGKPKTHQ
jgi:hypothetical protein